VRKKKKKKKEKEKPTHALARVLRVRGALRARQVNHKQLTRAHYLLRCAWDQPRPLHFDLPPHMCHKQGMDDLHTNTNTNTKTHLENGVRA
jgi:hypothetical protein